MAIRRTIPPHPQAPQLNELAERLRAWRATRRRGQRIPEELWKAATDLGHVHGLGPTASALKLNFYDLQSRLQAVRGQGKGFASQRSFQENKGGKSAFELGQSRVSCMLDFFLHVGRCVGISLTPN